MIQLIDGLMLFIHRRYIIMDNDNHDDDDHHHHSIDSIFKSSSSSSLLIDRCRCHQTTMTMALNECDDDGGVQNKP